MKQPVIGIAINEIFDSGEMLHHLPISYTPAGYVKAVQEVGGIPLLFPISTPQLAEQYVRQVDKLILTGGQNVDPSLYGEKPLVSDELFSRERDEFELALFNEAVKQGKPVFAVCRGLQLINVGLGGSLYQNLEEEFKGTVHHMQAPVDKEIPTHTILTEEKSILRDVYGKETKVNSFHWQGIKRLGEKLRITAYSSDGIIEGIEGEDFPLLGVQWHPDFAYNVLKQELDVFNFVVHKL